MTSKLTPPVSTTSKHDFGRASPEASSLEQEFARDFERLAALKEKSNRTTFEIVSRVVRDLSAYNLFLTCEDSRTHSKQIEELQQQIDELVRHFNANTGGKLSLSRGLTRSRNLNQSALDITAGTAGRQSHGFTSVTPVNCIELTEGSMQGNANLISKNSAENKA